MIFIRQIILYNLVTCLFLTHASYFDLDETNQILYAINISGEPVIMKEEIPVGSIRMVSKFGQAYYCNLPEQKINEKNENYDENMLPHVPSLLNDMKKSPCLTFTRNWWTYEYCHNNHIIQYHTDDNTRVKSAESVLGVYISDFDWSGVEQSDIHRKERFHSQFYGNGTLCDLTNEPRSAEVRFICRQDASDHIVSVQEPQTCTYRILISTARICQHPWLQSQDKAKPTDISCNPVLEESHYNQYKEEIKQQEINAQKKLQSEKMRSLFLSARIKQRIWKQTHMNAARIHREKINKKLFRRKLLKSTSKSTADEKRDQFKNLNLQQEQKLKQYLKKKKKNHVDSSDEFLSDDSLFDFSSLNEMEKLTASKYSQELNQVLKSQLKQLFKESYDELKEKGKENQNGLDDFETEYKKSLKNLDDIIHQMTKEIGKYDELSEEIKTVEEKIRKLKKEHKSTTDQDKTTSDDNVNTKDKRKTKSELLNDAQEKNRISDPKMNKLFEQQVRTKLSQAGIKKKIVNVKIYKTEEGAKGNTPYTADEKLATMLGKKTASASDSSGKLFGIVILSADDDDTEETRNFAIMSKNYEFQWKPSSKSPGSSSNKNS